MQLVQYSIVATDIQIDVVKREQARGCKFDSVCNLVHFILIYLLMFCIIETESGQLLLTVNQVKSFFSILLPKQRVANYSQYKHGLNSCSVGNV